jgi:polysaccharide biosynthesis protein PslH
MEVDTSANAIAPNRRPRILYISCASPVPAKLGPARRNSHVIDQLSRFYDVYVLSLGKKSDAEMFARDFGHRVKDSEFVSGHAWPYKKLIQKVWRTATARCDFLPVLDPGLRRACSRLVSTGSFEAIFLSSVLLRRLPLPEGISIIGDTHNVEFDLLHQISRLSDSFLLREYARWQWRSTRREEQRCGKNVDVPLATSEHDRQVFEQQLRIREVAVIPNGIDVMEFAPVGGARQPGMILFSGLMSYYPNQQAMVWFLNAIFPLILRKIPNATLVIVGAAPPGWLTARGKSSQVEVTGLVSDVRPYLARASVVIAPLLIGGGTRVKILEALAMAKPVVATSVGAEGLELLDRESVLIADDVGSFAEQVIRLLSDPDLAETIAANGRKYVLQHFDWNRIGERLSRVLQRRIGLAPREQLPVLMP